MIPVSQTLPDVNLDEILAALDTDTRDYLVLLLNDGAEGLGVRAQGPRAGAGDPAPGADREVRARDQRRARRAAAQPRARRAQLLAADRRARPARHAARELRPELQRRVRHAGRAGRGAARDAAEAARHAGDDAGRRWPRSRRWPTRLGPTLEALRPAARALGAVAAPDAAVPARDDADHPRRDPAVHARGAADGAGAAPGDARPRRRRRPTSRPRSTSSTGCSTRRPTTRPATSEEGFLFWQSWVNHAGNAIFSTAGRARPDPARPDRALVLDRAAARRGREREPAARDARRAAERARAGADLPVHDPGADGG